MAAEIVAAILDKVPHQQQKIPTRDIFRILSEQNKLPESISATDFNGIVRSLAQNGILETDMGSQLAGRRKASSKGKKVQVLRVGIASQEAKEILATAYRQNQLVEVTAGYLSPSDEIDTN